MTSRERIVGIGEVDLCVDDFGDPEDPAVLLIGGTSNPMNAWNEEFCDLLAAQKLHVVRYDSRDTGRSTSYPPGQPPYSFDDMVTDALGLLDVLGIDAANIVGMSLGGAIARALALDYPRRVMTLTLVSSSALAPADPRDPNLPGPSKELLAFFAQARTRPDLTNRDEYIDNFVLWDRQFAGSRYFDESEAKAYAAGVFDRTRDPVAASINHSAAGVGTPLRARNADIGVPTLIMHGSVDPILPIGHAEVLQQEIPNANLIRLDDVGHQMPPRALWPKVVHLIVDHCAR